ncbi:MAG: prepilin-type N-terminal cleavage/methylation domain-containing protein [Synergistota bacterium]|nr:prepilin-type N-terminal cleavage/methylation domain-containing protein [Synergistota bacterium]
MRLQSNAKKQCERGARKGLPFFAARELKRRAFSLIELLVVLLIVSTLGGAVSLLLGGSFFGDKSAAAVRDAENITRLLQHAEQRAILRFRAFDVKFLGGDRDQVMIHWYNPSEYQYYYLEEGCYVRFNSQGATQDKRFSPGWQTMTPGFTLNICSEKFGAGKVAQITFSVYGKVTLTLVE